MAPKLLFLALVGIVACKDKAPGPENPPAPEPTPHSAKTPKVAPAQPVSPPVKPPRPDLPSADVEALVDHWLAAQNEGNLDAYESSYATRMTGIKRVGAKETTYNRKDWLTDRGRMFRKAMKVTSKGQSVHTSPTSAVVRFEQTWASGKFKDVGPKQLIVIREDGALRIAREEMLASTVLSSRHGLAPALGALVFGAEGMDGFVLGKAQGDWATGPVALKGKNPFIATRDAKTSALPKEWRALLGSPISLFDGAEVCEDTIASVHIVSGVTPHFMFFQDENGDPMNIGAQGLADDIFEMGTPYVVARTSGECRGSIAQLGKHSSLGRVLTPATNSALVAKARQTFAKSLASKALQKDYESYSEAKPGPWATPDVQLFTNNEGLLALVAAEAGNGCGEFQGALTVLYQVGGDGVLEELGVLPVYFEAQAVHDFGNDGLLEIVGETRNYGSSEVTFVGTPAVDTPYSIMHRHSWDYHDCPC